MYSETRLPDLEVLNFLSGQRGNSCQFLTEALERVWGSPDWSNGDIPLRLRNTLETRVGGANF